MKSVRTTLFAKNVLASAVLQIVTVVTGFISPKLMLEAFGSEVNGITASILHFMAYLELVEAGLSNAAVFALFKPLAENNIEKRDAVVSATRSLYMKIGIIFAILACCLALIFPFLNHNTVFSYWNLVLFTLILGIQPAVNFFILAKYRAILTADQCGFYISYASAIQLIVNLSIITMTIHFGCDVIRVRLFALCSLFVTSLILHFIVSRKYPKINYYAVPDFKALDKRYDAMFLQILGVVVNGSPFVIMSMLLDFKLISVYSVYYMIAGSVSRCLSVFTSGLGAAFGNIYALGDKKLLSSTASQFRTALYMIMTVIYATMLATLRPFILLYTRNIHDVNYDIPLLGILITLQGVVFNFRAPHGMFIFSEGKFRDIKRQTLCQAVLVVVLCFLLTKMSGLNGCVAALCIADCYMFVELLILTPRILVQMSIKKNLLQVLGSIFIIMAVYGIATIIPWQIESFLIWIPFACLMFGVAVILTLIYYLFLDYKNIQAILRRIFALIA